MTARTYAPLTRALPSLAAWVQYFSTADIPVLERTAASVQALAAREAEGDDRIDAHLIAREVGMDPLMALRILSHVATKTSPRREGQIETITSALVLMGITPFFRHFAELPTLEALLGSHESALQGAQEVLHRGERSARFALGFAVQRMDHDANVMHQAALLHDFAELLLWVHAPQLALDIRHRQLADPNLRSADAQKDVLGIELAELQQALMKTWRMPELLIRLGDDRHAGNPSVRSVLLAVRVARHSAQGWQNAALPDDYREIGELLQIGAEHAHHLVMELDSDE